MTLSIDHILTTKTTLLQHFKDLKEPDDVTTHSTTPETTILPAITTDVALADDRKFEPSCTQNPFVLLLQDTHVRVYLNVFFLYSTVLK